MKPIIVRKEINAPIPKLWKAITNRKEMVQWFFENIPAFKAEVGFTTQFNVQSSERNFLHVWKVTEVEFEKKIACEWK